MSERDGGMRSPGLVRMRFGHTESIDEAVSHGCAVEGLRGVGQFDERIRKEIVGLTAFYATGFIEAAEACESPIEQLMAIYLFHLDHINPICDGPCTVEQQYEIQTGSGLYRVDFIIIGEMAGVSASLVVECDGHDFHEKTKAQATVDKQRDRALKLAGYDVIRFTGGEVWHRPMECAREVRRQFRGLIDRALRERLGKGGAEDDA